MNVSFFPRHSLVGSSSLPRLRIRSYIEIVSDISTLSFFPSRLVKYRRCVRASRKARKQRKGDGGSGEKRRRWQTVVREKETERGKKTEGQKDERRFALRRDRKRDSLGLVIYLKRSRAPCATTRGTPKLRRIAFSTRPNVRRNRGGDGDDDGDDENDSSLGGEEDRGPKTREKLSRHLAIRQGSHRFREIYDVHHIRRRFLEKSVSSEINRQISYSPCSQ